MLLSKDLDDKKKILKIALVSLYTEINLGITIIADYLLSKGKDVIAIYYLNKNYVGLKEHLAQSFIEELIELLREKEIDIVAFSVLSGHHKEAIRISQIVKERLGVQVIFGGWHPTLCPEECIPYCDILCIGEGEETLLELIDKIEKGGSISSVSGIWYKHNNRIMKNVNRPPIQDLDDIYKTINFERRRDYYIGFRRDNKKYFTIINKGCLFSCSYCNNADLTRLFTKDGRYYRKRSVDNLMEELIKAKRQFPDLKTMEFRSAVFPYLKEEFDDFGEKYLKYINLPFNAYTHFRIIKKEDLAKFKRFGLRELHLGMQSGSERFRKNVYNRLESNNEILEITEEAIRINMPVMCDLIFAPLIESQQDVKECAEFLLKLDRRIRYKIYDLMHLPKSTLTERLIKEGLIDKDLQERYSKTAHSWHSGLRLFNFLDRRIYYYLIITLIARSDVKLSLCKYFLENENFLNQFLVRALAFLSYMHKGLKRKFRK